MSQFRLSGKFGVKFGVETSQGFSSFRPVSQHTTVQSSVANAMRTSLNLHYQRESFKAPRPQHLVKNRAKCRFGCKYTHLNQRQLPRAASPVRVCRRARQTENFNKNCRLRGARGAAGARREVRQRDLTVATASRPARRAGIN